MAQMLYTTLVATVRDFISGKSDGSVLRAANLALEELYMVAGPAKRWTLSTTAPYSTGTVAITQGQTAVTLTTGTFATGTDGQLIRVAGDDTWFGFTRTGGATGTLSSAWTASTVTVATFEVVYAFYDFPTDILGAFKIWDVGEDPLHRVADEEYAQVLRASTTPAKPLSYAIVKCVTSGVSSLRAELIPYPDAAYSFTGMGKARATAFVGTGTEYTGLPEELDRVLLAGTLHYLWDQEDKQDRGAVWERKWRDGLDAASAHSIRGAVFEPHDEYPVWREGLIRDA